MYCPAATAHFFLPGGFFFSSFLAFGVLITFVFLIFLITTVGIVLNMTVRPRKRERER